MYMSQSVSPHFSRDSVNRPATTEAGATTACTRQTNTRLRLNLSRIHPTAWRCSRKRGPASIVNPGANPTPGRPDRLAPQLEAVERGPLGHFVVCHLVRVPRACDKQETGTPLWAPFEYVDRAEDERQGHSLGSDERVPQFK